MLKVLYELCSTKQAACIYTNYKYINEFHFGVVLAVNENEIAIQMISPDGEDDGITVMNVNDVIRVETNGQYQEKMKKLCSKEAIYSYDLSVEHDEILLAALQLAIREEHIVSIELLDSGYNDIIGFISAINDEECKIEQVDEYGFADGTSYVLYKNITKISISTKEEKRIEKLWMLNKKTII